MNTAITLSSRSVPDTTSTSSCPNEVIILDSLPYLSLLDSIEEHHDNYLDEDSLFSFLFKALEVSVWGLDLIDLELMKLQTDGYTENHLNSDITGGYMEVNFSLVKTIREIAAMLHADLHAYSCYENNLLVYSPMRQTNGAPPYRISLSPFVLLRVKNIAPVTQESIQW